MSSDRAAVANASADGGAAAYVEPAVVSRTADVLARLRARVAYAGVQRRRCMHMTSLCPDRCNHARAWALFTVVEWLAYEKPGQYGDDKAPTFAVQLEPAEAGVEHAPGFMDAVAGLAEGDALEIEWLHEYVTTTWEGGGSGKAPSRRVVAWARA